MDVIYFHFPMSCHASKAILSSGHGHGTQESELEGSVLEGAALASLPVSMLSPEEKRDEKSEAWKMLMGIQPSGENLVDPDNE